MGIRTYWIGIGIALIAAATSAVWIWRGTGRLERPSIDRPIPPLPERIGSLAITVFGTSLTARYDWPEVFAETLQKCLSRPVTITRVAKPGANSRWALRNVDRVKASAPDLVLVEFSINDADFLDGLSLAESQVNHDRLLTALAAGRPELRIVLLTMSPAIGLRGLLRRKLNAYYSLYAPLADRHGIGVVDLRMRWQQVDNLSKALPDGLHPTDDVARRIIVPPLLAAIGQAAGAECGNAAFPLPE